MFPGNSYYYIPLLLEALCVWHCLKKGNQQKWIWIIVFLPLVGCIVYFFSEIVSGDEISNVGSGLGNALNPGGRIRKLEARQKFADTFENRILLADAYLNAGQIERAIPIYEQSLTGVFSENEYGVMQLMTAYARAERYKELLPLAKKVYASPQFARSQAHIAYAKALAATGHEDAAEKEFQKMKSRFSAYEPRYHYGLFLLQHNRGEDAKTVFAEILDEEKHMSGREKRFHRRWFAKTREEVKRLQV